MSISTRARSRPRSSRPDLNHDHAAHGESVLPPEQSLNEGSNQKSDVLRQTDAVFQRVSVLFVFLVMMLSITPCQVRVVSFGSVAFR